MIKNPVSQRSKVESKISYCKKNLSEMAGSARRMRQDRELASKLQEEDDRMFAMSMHSGFGGTCVLRFQCSPLSMTIQTNAFFARWTGMKGNAKDSLKMTLLHKNFYNSTYYLHLSSLNTYTHSHSITHRFRRRLRQQRSRPCNPSKEEVAQPIAKTFKLYNIQLNQ